MYQYEDHKSYIFSDNGQRDFLKVRDCANDLLDKAGAFMLTCAWAYLNGGDSWEHMACVDRMVELGEIVEITKSGVAGQHRVFIRNT